MNVLKIILCLTFLFPILNAEGLYNPTFLENDRIHTLTAPIDKLNVKTAPKKLVERYNFSYAPYIHVYRFKVTRGHKYTFYMYHRAKGIYMNAYLRGDTPLTNHTASYGPSGYLNSFVCWGQQPRRGKCKYKVRRYNFRISNDSEHEYLYLVAAYAKPRDHFRVHLKTIADNDLDVEKDTNNPYCADQKFYHWGKVWKQEMLLTRIPDKKK